MAETLFQRLRAEGYDFFSGVPDSLLKPFLAELDASGVEHVPATDEANAVGIAVGAMLAGRKACVYMQNSGLGNAINPLTSLCLPFGLEPHLVIGHRHTLPQHRVMGEIDERLLELTGYRSYTIVAGDNHAE
jgi:phosphonopyruvate decarboxylase